MDLSLKPADIRLNTYKEMVGRTILDRYELLGLIGFGGMGAVFKGTQRAINRTVAIKILPKLDPLTAARFHREAKTASRLAHPNTITVFDFGQTPDDFLFLVMEHLEGRTLRSVLKECGRIHPSRAIHIATQICRSLSEAHSIGIVHRDIKPDNVFLINRDDDPDYVKVLDFGIAKVLAGDEVDADLTQQGRIVGTPRYMAPEQVMSLPIDHRADIYSLGVILYQMITGTPPFDDSSTPMLMMKHAHETPQDFADRLSNDHEAMGHIPAGLEGIVMRSLSKRPEDRQQTVDQLRIELSQVRMSLSGMHPLPPMGGYTSGLMPALSTLTPNPSNQSSPHISSQEMASMNAQPGSTSNPSLSSPSMQGMSNAAASQQLAALSSPSHPSHPSLSGMHPNVTSNPSLSNPSLADIATGAAQPNRRGTLILIGLALVGLLLGAVGIGAVIVSLGGSERSGADVTGVAGGDSTPATDTPPVAPSETPVRITIETTPSGANVLSGDFQVGTTPMVIEVPSELKMVTYRIEKTGFEPVAKDFDIPRLPGREVTWRIDLTATGGDAPKEVASARDADTTGGTLTPTPPTSRASTARVVRQPVNRNTTSPRTNEPKEAVEAPKEVVETPPKDDKTRKPQIGVVGEGGTDRKPKVNAIGETSGTGKTDGTKPKVSVPTIQD